LAPTFHVNEAEAIRVAGCWLLPLAIAGWISGTGRSRTIFIAPDDVAQDALLAVPPALLPDLPCRRGTPCHTIGLDPPAA
jgi:hypothetical protein